ncbi:MAG: peptidylprolyl isomerase [Geobacter sp.]|nr:peptidylprolyl isomerase [Geobacter sp.]
MSSRKITAIFLSSLAMLVLQTAMAVGADETKKAAPAEAVAAKVNGVAISRVEVERAAKAIASQNPAMPEDAKELEKKAVDQLVTAEVLYQAGKKIEIKDLDKLVSEQIVKARERFPNPEDYKKALDSFGMTEKELETIARKDIVINKLLEKELTPTVKVTDEDLKKFYDENKEKFKTGEMVKASHILVGVDEKATAEEKTKSKEKAEAILKRVKGGEDFAEVAMKESTCPSGKQGGDLGSFGKGQMVPPFEKVAFSLKPGEISDVVETQFGYHIIKLTEKREAGYMKIEDVKERLQEYLMNQKRSKAFGDFLEKLKKEAKIEIL